MTGRSRTRRGSGLRLPGASSLMARLARSIMLGLALLWLTGVIGSAVSSDEARATKIMAESESVATSGPNASITK